MRKLFLFVCGFTVATGVLIYFFGGMFLPACPVLAITAAALFFIKGTASRRWAIFFLGMTMGTVWCSGFTAQKLAPTQDVCGQSVSFHAKAAEYAAQTRYGFAVTADVLLNGREVGAVLYFSEPVDFAPGDGLSGTAKFEQTSMDVFHENDLYHISRGVYLTGNVEGVLEVVPARNQDLQSLLRRIAGQLKQNLHTAFPDEAAGYFTALAIGDRSGLSYALKNRLAVAGLYHAVSLSGMHISILMSALLLLCLHRKRLAALLGIPTILLFCILSGGNPATIRAVTMHIVLLACLFLDREYDSITALAFALLLLLLENPWSFAHWGLQLSFASTSGILLLMPKFRELPIKSRILRRVLQPVFVTLSATVFSAPLMSLYFGLNSLVAPLTNVLALWSVALSFVGGILVSLLGFASGSAAQAVGLVLCPLYDWLILVTNTCSDIPFAAVYDDTPLLLAWSYLLYLLPVLCLWLRPKWTAAVLCAAVTLLGAWLLTPKVPDGITALDVGQGQCVLLCREKAAVMVDCGGQGDDTGEDAARYLLSRGIWKLDALVISHFDADHCDGVVQLLDRIPVKTVYVPLREQQSELEQELCENAEATIIGVTEPLELPIGDGLVTVYPAVGGKGENDTGLSVLASAEECDILITGDLDTSAEARLVRAYDLPDLEVLVAGHHGAQDSTGPALLDVLRPETVLISVGENAFGHPDEQTLQRIAASGAQVYSTKDNGNLTLGW